MGATESTSQGGEVRTTRTGEHSPLPKDLKPYQGTPLECSVITVPVEMRSKWKSVTSNIDDYYPAISRYLQQGYTLNTFCPLPRSASVAGFNKHEVVYDAIFSRSVEVTTRRDGNGLMVEKSVMHFENSRGGRIADSSDIMRKIMHHTSKGGRLICLEMNGQAVMRGFGNFGLNKGIGVDILFVIPKEPAPAKYVYQVINVPLNLTLRTMGHQTSHCDWQGTFSSYLNRGWKLVRVAIDGSRERESWKEFSVNSVWIFEKETSKLHDTTPVYEGVIIEYYHQVSTQGSVKTNWSPVIVEMGRRGWELACIQETGEMSRTGFMKLEMKLNMFFQRKIVAARGGVPPPLYSSRPTSYATTPLAYTGRPSSALNPPGQTHLPHHHRPFYPPSEPPSYPPSYHSQSFD